VGSVNNHAPRDITVSFDFLPAGTYQATIYTDSPESDIDANLLSIQNREVTPQDEITLHLAGGGGEVMRITAY